MKVMIFLDIYVDKGILPCIKVRKNAKIKLKKRTHSKKPISYWHKEMICKNGRIAVSYGKRWIVRNCIFFDKEDVWRVCLLG